MSCARVKATYRKQVTLMTLRTKLSAVSDWLMQPVLRAKRASRRLVVQAIRSRFFWLATGLSSLALLWEASYATFKAAKAGLNDPLSSTLLWALALVIWVFFLITVYERYTRLKSKRGGLPRK